MPSQVPGLASVGARNLQRVAPSLPLPSAAQDTCQSWVRVRVCCHGRRLCRHGCAQLATTICSQACPHRCTALPPRVLTTRHALAQSPVHGFATAGVHNLPPDCPAPGALPSQAHRQQPAPFWRGGSRYRRCTALPPPPKCTASNLPLWAHGFATKLRCTALQPRVHTTCHAFARPPVQGLPLRVCTTCRLIGKPPVPYPPKCAASSLSLFCARVATQGARLSRRGFTPLAKRACPATCARLCHRGCAQLAA